MIMQLNSVSMAAVIASYPAGLLHWHRWMQPRDRGKRKRFMKISPIPSEAAGTAAPISTELSENYDDRIEKGIYESRKPRFP
jgi:hypothetical protein